MAAIIIGSKKKPVRFSYPAVFKPKAMQEGGELKYSVSILIPKTDTELLNKVKAAIAEAEKEGASKLGKKPWKNPLRDGDIDRPDDASYHNCFFISANSTRKPEVVDSNLEEIMNSDDFYAGCYGRASVNFYAFSVPGNKGIATGLNNIQKTADGERLSGASSAADDFGDDDDDDMM